MAYVQKNNPFKKTNDEKEEYLNSFHSSITKLASRRSNKGLPEINDIQILNRAILHFSEFPEKPFQNAKSIREEAELKINPSAIKRFQKEGQNLEDFLSTYKKRNLI